MSYHPSPQVYGLGQCALDAIGKIEAYPPPDVKCEFSGMVIQGGGPVATALVALSRWGLSCAFSGVLGDDLFGKMTRTSLDEEGVDTTGLLVREGYESQFAFIAAEPETGRRTIFWRRPTGPPPTPDEIDYERVRGARVVLTDGLFPDAALAACHAAREAGIPVVVDAGSLRDGMLEIAGVSDFFLASENFAQAFLGEDDPRKACEKLAEIGPTVTGVTLGAKGYVAWADGSLIVRPAYHVNAVDTTGCGDVFHAGFVYGVVQGWEIEKSLDFGAWAASMASLELGGRAGIPTLDRVRKQGYLAQKSEVRMQNSEWRIKK
jgi:sulfofructose kinase